MEITEAERSFLEYLVDRMWSEAAHLDKYPGMITFKAKYSDHTPEERAALREKHRQVREEFKVIHATHTVSNLREWSNKLRGILEGVNRT